jgi:hypothetical protein
LTYFGSAVIAKNSGFEMSVNGFSVGGEIVRRLARIL